MRPNSTNRASLFFALLADVAIFILPVGYSQQPSGPLPDALQKLVETKQETIKQTVDRNPESEWVGTYFSQDGLTAGTVMSWHPDVGFIVRWSTCSHGWRESANYGAALIKNGILTLSPELTGGDRSVYQMRDTLVPVLWGQQHYFIWSNRLFNFCYAVANSNAVPEVDAFFLKDVDREKPRNGLPNVPSQYRKYLSND